MEQQQNSLPSNIDSEILKLSSDNTAMLNSIAVGWKSLTASIQVKDTKIAELEKQLSKQNEEQNNVTD